MDKAKATILMLNSSLQSKYGSFYYKFAKNDQSVFSIHINKVKVNITYMSSQQIKSTLFNRTMGQQSGSAKTHLDSVSQLTKTARISYQNLDDDLQKLLKEINILRDQVKNNPTELKKFFKMKLKPVQDSLVIGEESQKQQNKVVQQEMTEIKRQNRQTGDAIVKTFEKLKYMETRIGQYL